jgi:hypothetical protein
MGFALKDEPVPDAIPLSARERTRKAELEQIVQYGLEKFLEVGLALRELRNSRLYRVEHPTFEAYVQARFGLHRSAVDGVIRSAQVAQVLLEAGLELPPDTTATLMRPIAALPGDDSLKCACWELAKHLSPARAPSQPLVSKLCRLVRHLADGNGDPAPAHCGRPHGPVPPERETPFVRPVLRLSSWSGFSAEMIVSHLGQSTDARGVYSACGILAERCREVQARLLVHFPELEITTTDGFNNQS